MITVYSNSILSSYFLCNKCVIEMNNDGRGSTHSLVGILVLEHVVGLFGYHAEKDARPKYVERIGCMCTA